MIAKLPESNNTDPLSSYSQKPVNLLSVLFVYTAPDPISLL